MVIIDSRRRYFVKPNNEEEYVGRIVRFKNEERNIVEKFISCNELQEAVDYQDIINYLESDS
jgi:hypothetical protein